MFPLIPTASGMFLCERSYRDGWSAIAVRTFIAKRQFSARQARIHSALLTARAWIGKVPFFLYLAFLGEDHQTAMSQLQRDTLYRFCSLWLEKLRGSWDDLAAEWTMPPGQHVSHAPTLNLLHERFDGAIEKSVDSEVRRALVDTPSCPLSWSSFLLALRDGHLNRS
jgi:hypothetical protein